MKAIFGRAKSDHLSDYWKVPFRQSCSENFIGHLFACWSCIRATVKYRLTGRFQ